MIEQKLQLKCIKNRKTWVSFRIKKIEGETYITTTHKGDDICLKIISDLIALMKIHSIAPKAVEESVYEDQYPIKKGVKPFFKGIADLETVVQHLLFNTKELNKQMP